MNLILFVALSSCYFNIYRAFISFHIHTKTVVSGTTSFATGIHVFCCWRSSTVTIALAVGVAVVVIDIFFRVVVRCM